MSNASKSAARAAAAAAVTDFTATGRAVTVGKPGVARAPATEPNDDDIARAAAAAATMAARDATPAAPANPYDEYGPIVAPAAPAADWLDEFGPIVAPAATAPAATAPAAAKPAGVKGWAKAGAVYHADDAVIAYVAPNPKKPGSATYTRYAAAYAVGRTIAQAKKLGATAGDILWDLPRGFIQVTAPARAAD